MIYTQGDLLLPGCRTMSRLVTTGNLGPELWAEKCCTASLFCFPLDDRDRVFKGAECVWSRWSCAFWSGLERTAASPTQEGATATPLQSSGNSLWGGEKILSWDKDLKYPTVALKCSPLSLCTTHGTHLSFSTFVMSANTVDWHKHHKDTSFQTRTVVIHGNFLSRSVIFN